jgi:hypothetical protein
MILSAEEEKGGGGETYYSYSSHSTEEKSDSPSFFRKGKTLELVSVLSKNKKNSSSYLQYGTKI